MVTLPAASLLDTPQHLVLDGISWEFYESVLSEIGNRAIRVAFDEGRIEIMSPLPEHEIYGTWLGRLVELLGLELELEVIGLGSTTFRDSAARKGLEPDECFYVQNADKVTQISGEFDPGRHCAPDLAIEVEVTRKAIAREPIYAALRVPEVWHVSARRIQCRVLRADGTYQDADRSLAFPFLAPADLLSWVQKLSAAGKTVPVLKKFQAWVRTLK
ncbi:Uma2 family endonuclease [Humisphaera borealis]|uniref:Uma2 family endonuclease n=1 Tax=Humisphaera borealis TaxID=2807512 RepID=A0A7M2WUG9_9BACT|nr:Uma2 family endonuclease [Humisphaera borealis]QOV89165.1 Uma2 family endonuclease [Humisphaera borealis]